MARCDPDDLTECSVPDGRAVLFAALAGSLLAMTLLAGAAEIVRGPRAAVVSGSPAPAAEFAAKALGSLKISASASERPDGQGAVVRLPAGTPVEIGGLAKVGRLPFRRSLFWVHWQVGGPPAYGFAPRAAVSVAAGTPPRIGLDALGYDADGHPLAERGPSGTRGGPSAGAAASAGRAAAAAIVIPWLPPTVASWRADLVDAAARYGVDPELLAIVVLVESGGNPAARSPSGAMGLMQVMPFHFGSGEDGYDVATNVDVGARYLAQQLRAFGAADDPDWQQSVELAAAAYNGGPGSVQRLLSGGSLPSESATYRTWVGGMWRERHLAASPTYERWLAAGGSSLVAAAAEATVARGS